MNRIFDRNMFIMLLAIMLGVIIITYFLGDIVNRTEIETLNIEHQTEIVDISSRNENFTDNFLQGSIKMDAAREAREYGNYFFDFAMLWYNTALVNDNETQFDIQKEGIVDNCTKAIEKYTNSYQGFLDSWPYFENAKNFTERDKYLEVLDFYTSFAISGQNLTQLRIQSSQYLTYIAENLTFEYKLSNITLNSNITGLIELLEETMGLTESALEEYEELKGQIDDYLFFDEIREEQS